MCMCPGSREFNVDKELKKLAVNFDLNRSNLGKAWLHNFVHLLCLIHIIY